MNRGIEISVPAAKQALQSHQRAFGKPRTRIHVGAAELKTAQLQILEGALCAQCRFFRAFNNGKAPNGYAQIELKCGQGLDPITVYRNTSFLEDPHCNKFEQK